LIWHTARKFFSAKELARADLPSSYPP